MITLDFPPRSDLSRRAPCDVPLTELRRFAGTELERRRQTYPLLVKRGRLADAEADRRLATWAAIGADLDREAAFHERVAGRNAPAASTFPWQSEWSARVLDLRRELAAARDTLPAAIASPANPMTAAAGAAHVECLDALLHRYWVDLTDFSGPAVPMADDHARIAWIASAEHRTSAAPEWVAIGRIADAYLAGTADDTARSRAQLLADWTHAQGQRLLEERAAHHRFVWTVQADAWLLARSRAPH